MNPLASLSICLGLLTICWAIVLLQRARDHRARFLIGMVGLVTIFQAVRLLLETGMLQVPSVDPYYGLVDLIVAILYFVALLFLYAEASRRRVTEVQLRLSQAMEAPAPRSDGSAVRELRSGRPLASPLRRPKKGDETEEAMLHRLIQSSPVAIVALRQDGKVCTLNAAAEDLYGATAEELLGKTLPPLPGGLSTQQEAPPSGRQQQSRSNAASAPSGGLSRPDICRG